MKCLFVILLLSTQLVVFAAVTGVSPTGVAVYLECATITVSGTSLANALDEDLIYLKYGSQLTVLQSASTTTVVAFLRPTRCAIGVDSLELKSSLQPSGSSTTFTISSISRATTTSLSPVAGPIAGGRVITFIGTYLGDPTLLSVTVGGVSASITATAVHEATSSATTVGAITSVYPLSEIVLLQCGTLAMAVATNHYNIYVASFTSTITAGSLYAMDTADVADICYQPRMAVFRGGDMIVCYRKISGAEHSCICNTRHNSGTAGVLFPYLYVGDSSAPPHSCIAVPHGHVSHTFSILSDYIGADGFSDMGIMHATYADYGLRLVVQAPANLASASGDETLMDALLAYSNVASAIRVTFAYRKTGTGQAVYLATTTGNMKNNPFLVSAVSSTQTIVVTDQQQNLAAMYNNSLVIAVWRQVDATQGTTGVWFRAMNMDVGFACPATQVWAGSTQYPVVAARDGGGFAIAAQSGSDVWIQLYTKTYTATGATITITTAQSPRLFMYSDSLMICYLTALPGSPVCRKKQLDLTHTVVITTPANVAGTASIVVQSTILAPYTVGTSFTYRPQGTISSVTPSSFRAAGSSTVTILAAGSQIGTGSDITSVTLNGVPVTSIGAQTTSSVTVVSAAGSGTGNVVTLSTEWGASLAFASITYNPIGTITTAVPAMCPAAGGLTVTILASSAIGSGSDVTQVSLVGVVATIGSQTSTQVVVTCAAASSGTGSIVVQSVAFAQASLASSFTYNPVGTITGATPNNIPAAGGATVTIAASTAIGSGSDITGVTLCGTAVGSIVAQTATSVTVQAAARAAIAGCSIVVTSTHFGVATLGAAFTYNPAGTLSSVTPNNVPVAGGSTVTVLASSQIGDGSDITAVTLCGSSATVGAQTTSSVTVVAAAGSAASGCAVVVTSYHFGVATLPTAFTYNPVGVISSLTPSHGRHDGGNTVTVTASSAIGSGADITSVSIGGVAATITGQSANVVTIQPANGDSIIGLNTIVVSSVSFGVAQLSNAYRYNAAGVWSSIAPTAGANGVAGNSLCQVVTVAGTGIGSGSDVTQVAFAGVPAVIASQNANQVLVYPPTAIAGSVQIIVSSVSIGQTVSPAGAYTFEAATISALSMTNGPVGGGRTITISATNTANALATTSVRFGTVSAAIVQTTMSSAVVSLPVHWPGSIQVSLTTCYGTLVGGSNFTYNPLATFTTIAPDIGRYSGGFSVTITAGSSMGDGTDITTVLLNNVAAQIVSQSPTTVTVVAGDATSLSGNRNGSVSVESLHWGTVTLPFAFVYRPVPIITQVRPNLGNMAGATRVTITGTDLGLGNDINYVALADIQAALLTQSSTAITVIADAASAQVLGGVNVSSPSFGLAFLPNSFSYAELGIITGVVPSSGPSVGGNVVTVLGGLGAGDDITAVRFGGQDALILSQTSGSVVIRLLAATPGAVEVRVVSYAAGNSIKANGYTYNIPGEIVSVTPRVGPYSGFRITIVGSNLCAGDITSATVINAATVISQSASQVILQLPPGIGSGVVVLSSAAFGTTTTSFAQSVTFNPAGVIYSVAPAVTTISAGALVTIVGVNLGSGSDVVNVTVAGVQATIVTQLSSLLFVRVPVLTYAALGPVVVESTLFGVTTSVLQFYFKPRVVLQAVSSIMYERGGPVSVLASLDCMPSANVSVRVVGSAFVSVDVASLVFTPLDWHIPQSFSMLAEVDNKVTGDRACAVQIASNSSDPLFHNLQSSPDVTVKDSDNATLLISRGTFAASAELALGGYFLMEGDSKSLQVALSSVPRAPVNVSLTVADSRVIAPVYVYFTAANWNVTQTVAVSAVPDGMINQHALTWTQLMWVPATQDTNFATAVASTQFLILDNDLSSAIQIVSSGTLRNVSETGAQSAFFVVLTKHITGSAVATASLSSAAEAIVEPASRTLTDADFLVPQSFVVTGQDDWIQDGDVMVSVQLSITISGVSSMASITLYNQDNDTAGVRLSSAEYLTVNETGSTELITMALTSEPLSAVTIRCSSSDQTEVIVQSPAAVDRTSSNWRASVLFVVQGVRDAVHDNRSVAVNCTTSSSDSLYNGLRVGVIVRNVDIYWPNISIHSPSAFPLVNINGSFRGSDFEPTMTVHVNGVPMADLMYRSPLEFGFRTPVLNNVAIPTNTTAVATDPIHSNMRMMNRVVLTTSVGGVVVNGVYLNVTLRNPGGGWLTYSKMYFTEDCPEEGQFGRGANCTACPTGAFCPGGYRLWALPGYWASSEFAGSISPCLPGHCLGGQEMLCSAPYRGSLCSQCNEGYYMQGSDCYKCAEQYVQVLLLLAQFAFSFLLLIAVLFASDRALNNVMFCLSCVKTLWVVSADGEGRGLPGVVVQIYGIFGLFAGDLTFVRPGCTGLTSYLQLYGINVGVMLGVVVPIALVYYLRYRRGLFNDMQDDLGEKERETVRAMHFSTQSAECARGVVTQLLFAYQIVLIKCFQTLYCVEQEGSLVLLIDANEVCFTARHLTVFVLSIVLCLAVGALLPAYLMFLVVCFRNQQPLHPWQRAIATNAVEEVQHDVWWFPTVCVMALDLPLALVSVFLSANSFAQNLVNVFVNMAACAFVTWRKPFREWFKNAGLILTMLVAFLTQVSALLQLLDDTVAAGLISYFMLFVLFVWLAGLVVVFLYYGIYLPLIMQKPSVFPDDVAFQQFAQKTDSEEHVSSPPVKRMSFWTSELDVISPIHTPAELPLSELEAETSALIGPTVEEEAAASRHTSASASPRIGTARMSGASPRIGTPRLSDDVSSVVRRGSPRYIEK
eukprot:TRINITY_DN3077_c0_g1_i1.p1 TRINITY_DN3077_c0_g1~~TRINITY_DN3077_c0_g1_i1.p1  ORF type:complete len:2771 (+),score=647.15 TRINITY_DN3077_c0_g1_i1:106-8418(+)